MKWHSCMYTFAWALALTRHENRLAAGFCVGSAPMICPLMIIINVSEPGSGSLISKAHTMPCIQKRKWNKLQAQSSESGLHKTRFRGLLSIFCYYCNWPSLHAEGHVRTHMLRPPESFPVFLSKLLYFIFLILHQFLGRVGLGIVAWLGSSVERGDFACRVISKPC